ncbi:pantoate--beta-alanine ligase [Marinicauda algicola]|nr:pantoate--beta-alanine ligase [Marinicauda algicola]
MTDTVAGLRDEVQSWREAGYTVGFVPTMGALHAGHISLVRTALQRADRVVASVFVNPAQFAPGEDFETYPRTLEEDAAKLAEAGCHLLYAPTVREMYPTGFASAVHVDGPAFGLESQTRPHFFGGVATVVTKLLNQVRPDTAVFGEKDYQQLLVIRRLVTDLDLGVEIVAGETLREGDGLAMSSRNAYLSAEERGRAGQLNLILKDLAQEAASGKPLETSLLHARTRAEEVFDAVDYIEIRNAHTLQAIETETLEEPARVLAAVRVGKTRLIDNMAV